MKSYSLLLAGLLLTTVSLAEPGQDASPWPQFRSPDGQGHSTLPLPTTWAEDKNVAWKTPLPGKGWSSPVVAGGKAWVTTAVTAAGGGGTSLRFLGVDLKTGKLAQDVELFNIAKVPALHARNTPASPTPAVVGDNVIASFGSAGVGCVAATTGKVLWRLDTFKVDYETGAGSSPVPYKDRVILNCDGADKQFVVALDAATGKEIWRTQRTGALKKIPNERRAFSTPLVIRVGEKDQVVIPGAHCVYSYDPDTGKELWRVTYTGFSNVLRPVFANGLVVISTGYFGHELLAIRPDGQGDVTETHIAWRFKKAVPNISSPLLVGGALYMISDQGILTCLDGTTGESKWTARLSGTNTASPLAHGGTIYAFLDDGSAVLFKAGAKFEQVGKNTPDGRVQATPAVVPGGLLVRTEGALYLVSESHPGKPR